MKKSILSAIRHFKIHVLKIWNSQNAEIKFRVFFGKQVTVGSDRKANLKLSGIHGFEAQINFEESKLVWLERDAPEAIERDRIFQVGPYAILWSSYHPVQNTAVLWKSTLVASVLALIWMGTSLGSSEPHCSLLEKIVASGRWSGGGALLNPKENATLESLQKSSRSFKEALKEGAFVRARAELQAMRKGVATLTAPAACGVMAPIDEMELKFSRKLMGDYLKDDDVLGAAREWARMRQMEGPREGRSSVYERRLLAAARDLYMEGYRLEEEDTERAYELMERAREVCRTMNEGDECFRKKAKSPN